MNKPTDVVIIFYMTGPVKHYIAASTWNTRRQIVATFTTDFLQAQQWATMPEANQIIRDLCDNNVRHYKAEWITMDLPLDFRFRSIAPAGN